MARYLRVLVSLALFVAFAAALGPGAQAAGPMPVTFSNTSGITIPASGNTNVSTLDVSGLSGTITSVTATINGLTTDNPGELAVYLASPDTSVFLMARAGDAHAVSGVDLTFAGDPAPCPGATNVLPYDGQINAGTYAPTNYQFYDATTLGCGASFGMSKFNGTSPNGEWQLQVGTISDYPGTATGGSIASWSVTITTDTFTFSGFFPPVNSAASNTVKAGSAVPIKFSLSGYQGMDIFQAGYPKVQFTDCTTGDLIGAPVSAANPGNSALQYDPGTDTYTFVWKTQKDWAGTCGVFELGLNDGSTHQASFVFK